MQSDMAKSHYFFHRSCFRVCRGHGFSYDQHSGGDKWRLGAIVFVTKTCTETSLSTALDHSKPRDDGNRERVA